MNNGSRDGHHQEADDKSDCSSRGGDDTDGIMFDASDDDDDVVVGGGGGQLSSYDYSLPSVSEDVKPCGIVGVDDHSQDESCFGSISEDSLTTVAALQWGSTTEP